MAFIENFLVPLTQAVISIGMFFLLLAGIYFLAMKFAKDRIFRVWMWIKYKIMKKPYNEKMVLWSMEMIEKKVMPEMLMREFYTTNKFKLNDFDEGQYIYYKIKQMQR